MKKEKHFILDGYAFRFNDDDDLTNDLKGEIALNQNIRNETQILQPTETAETIKELNTDVLDSTRASSIDLKARLGDVEVGAILVFDTLVRMRFLPNNALFLTRQRKRLSVSEGGLGRKEIVEIVRGIKEDANKGNFFDKLASSFGSKKD